MWSFVDCENILYSVSVKENSRNVLNSLMVRNNCENIYFGKGVIDSFNVFFSHFIKNSSNIRFSSNLVGCHECILCEDLQNQSYCIRNKTVLEGRILFSERAMSG